MSDYIEESTTDTPNLITGNQKNDYKQKFLDQANYNSDSNAQTLNFTDNPFLKNCLKKITPNISKDKDLDDQLTTKEPFQKSKYRISDDQATIFKSKLKKNKKSSALNPSEKIFSESFKIPENAKVQKSLTGESQRQKYSDLLAPAHQRSISCQHKNLLKMVKVIDETIEFMNKYRSAAKSGVFFQYIQKQAKDSLRIFLKYQHLQQLLYLNQNLYDIKWEFSITKKAYDMLISFPTKLDPQRKDSTKLALIQYLSKKYEIFLSENKTFDNENKDWHPGFQYWKFDIPRKSLLIPPQLKVCQTRQTSDENRNQSLKVLISQPQSVQTASFTSKQAMDMIFSNKGNAAEAMQQKLFSEIKKRSQQKKSALQAQEKRKKYQASIILPDTLLLMVQQIYFIYVSRHVSNMFQIKLLQLIQNCLKNKFSVLIIHNHLEYLLGLKDIGFLKPISNQPKDKPKILMMNKGKMGEMKQFLKKMKDQGKQEIKEKIEERV